MHYLLLTIHVIISLAIILLVLLQRGKGATAGMGFGGAANTVFGSQGATPFLAKLTGILLVLFFVTSLGLGYLSVHANKPTVVLTKQHTA